MDDNIFDNDVNVTPGLAGQVATPAEGNPTPATPPVEEGKVATPPAEGNTPADWQKEFESPEKMYEALQKTKQSYDNLRPVYTKTTQELSQLRKSVIAPQPATPQGQPQVPVQNGQQLQNPNPIDVVNNMIRQQTQPLLEKQAELEMQTSVMRMMQEKTDFAELAPTIKTIFEQNPALWDTADPLNLAYMIAKASSQTANVDKLVSNARNEAYADKTLKVINGDVKTPANVQPPEKSEEQLTRERIVGAFARNKTVF